MLRVSNPYKTPEFKALFQQWNQVLEADGHKEIEDFTLPDTPLKTWEALKWDNSTRDLNSQRTYYELAEDVLNTFRFKNERHRIIWAMHCDGMSVRQIEQGLRFWLWELTKSNVHQTIVRIERQSGLKRG